MEKRTLVTFIILLSLARPVYAQENTNEKNILQNNTREKNKKHKSIDATSCRKAYIGFSTGINNPGGFIGVDIDVPIAKNVSIGAGFGSSTWGNKIYLDGRYYLKPCHRGFALGAGITHNTGNTTYTTRLRTIYGNKEVVTLKLDPQTNAFIGVYYFWTLGKRYNRLYAAAGYSVPFATYHYTEITGAPLSNRGERMVEILSPGGFMLGAGFSFGMH
ncbi:MAG: hypothetical protein ACHQD8_06850 [Chitinophagales bacterium]